MRKQTRGGNGRESWGGAGRRRPRSSPGVFRGPGGPAPPPSPPARGGPVASEGRVRPTPPHPSPTPSRLPTLPHARRGPAETPARQERRLVPVAWRMSSRVRVHAWHCVCAGVCTCVHTHGLASSEPRRTLTRDLRDAADAHRARGKAHAAEDGAGRVCRGAGRGRGGCWGRGALGTFLKERRFIHSTALLQRAAL